METSKIQGFETVDIDKLGELAVLTKPLLTRKQWNSWKKLLSEALGEGGDEYIKSLFPQKTRKAGAGRPELISNKDVINTISDIVKSVHNGASRSELQYIPGGYGLRRISSLLKSKGVSLSYLSVAKALNNEGFAVSCSTAKKNMASPRLSQMYNEQLAHINSTAGRFLDDASPVIMINCLSESNCWKDFLRNQSIINFCNMCYSGVSDPGISSIYNSKPHEYYPYDINSKCITKTGTRCHYGFIQLDSTNNRHLFEDALSSWFNQIGNTLNYADNKTYIILDSISGHNLDPDIDRFISFWSHKTNINIYLSLFPPSRFRWGGIRHQTVFYTLNPSFHIDMIVSLIGFAKNGDSQLGVKDNYSDILSLNTDCKAGYASTKREDKVPFNYSFFTDHSDGAESL